MASPVLKRRPCRCRRPTTSGSTATAPSGMRVWVTSCTTRQVGTQRPSSPTTTASAGHRLRGSSPTSVRSVERSRPRRGSTRHWGRRTTRRSSSSCPTRMRSTVTSGSSAGPGPQAALEAFVNAKGELTGDQHAGNLFFNPGLASTLGPSIAGAYVGGFASPPGDVMLAGDRRVPGQRRRGLGDPGGCTERQRARRHHRWRHAFGFFYGFYSGGYRSGECAECGRRRPVEQS